MLAFEEMTLLILDRFRGVCRGRDAARLDPARRRLNDMMESLGDVQPACVLRLREDLKRIGYVGGLMDAMDAYADGFEHYVLVRRGGKVGASEAALADALRRMKDAL